MATVFENAAEILKRFARIAEHNNQSGIDLHTRDTTPPERDMEREDEALPHHMQQAKRSGLRRSWLLEQFEASLSDDQRALREQAAQEQGVSATHYQTLAIDEVLTRRDRFWNSLTEKQRQLYEQSLVAFDEEANHAGTVMAKGLENALFESPLPNAPLPLLTISWPPEMDDRQARTVLFLLNKALGSDAHNGFDPSSGPFRFAANAEDRKIHLYNEKPQYQEPLNWDKLQQNLERLQTEMSNPKHWRPVNTTRGQGYALTVPHNIFQQREEHSSKENVIDAIELLAMSSRLHFNHEYYSPQTGVRITYLEHGQPISHEERNVQCGHSPYQYYGHEEKMVTLTGAAILDMQRNLGISFPPERQSTVAMN